MFGGLPQQLSKLVVTEEQRQRLIELREKLLNPPSAGGQNSGS
jgi:hypothetical protein